MNHKEWEKEVRKKLIDKEWTIPRLAVEVDRSPEWAYQQISGRVVTTEGVRRISEKLEIESYL